MSVALTTTYWKIKAIKKRIKIVQGSQGAGKNVAIAIIFLQDCIERQPEVSTVMSDTYPNLKDGAIRDFENVFRWAGLNWDKYYNKNERELRYKGHLIQFRYINDSIKNPTMHFRRRKNRAPELKR